MLVKYIISGPFSSQIFRPHCSELRLVCPGFKLKYNLPGAATARLIQYKPYKYF